MISLTNVNCRVILNRNASESVVACVKELFLRPFFLLSRDVVQRREFAAYCGSPANVPTFQENHRRFYAAFSPRNKNSNWWRYWVP
jgi:hypothetical protein